ncbi:uncharacterized protein E0L32_005287 [Thyridium curvatum]|uniref:Enoyl reductase (ER) domain-containing protein n=1 Tax=Thyridium curvatum TaxID=1093900 RepID=A0A507AUV8_9PEZI|nr:uncharacterized protein E0L32_005287 [Thyridium curvatum]TPX14595.1 hypothetical protein E0L32_005287 [Thyridium curvatum]
MPSNTAAVLTAVKTPFEIKEHPYPEPKDHEVVVRARALALNPADWAQQAFGPAFFLGMTLPCVVGGDVAGDVEQVGAKVEGIRPGDRVAGLSTAAFQHHVLLPDHMLTPIPDALSYEQASVLPLTLSTAVKALFHPDYLGMRVPAAAGPRAEPTGETVLIWGASTSVGSSAIQLAVAAGYEVITTASPGNFARAKRLGASAVFDYNSPTVKEDLVAAFRGKRTAGAVPNAGLDFSVYPAVIDACAVVVASVPGKKFLACTMARPNLDELPEGVEGKFVDVLRPDTELAYKIYREYLPAALADGSFVAEPKAQVIGKGLEAIQGGLDQFQSKVLSATKLVVTL